MNKIFFIYMVNLHYLIESLTYTQDKQNCVDYSDQDYTVKVMNTLNCQISFTYNRNVDDTLELININLSDFQATQSFSQLKVQDSTLSMCSFQLNFLTNIYFTNVIFDGSGCTESKIELYQNSKMILQGGTVQANSFVLQGVYQLEAKGTTFNICSLDLESFSNVLFNQVNINQQCLQGQRSQIYFESINFQLISGMNAQILILQNSTLNIQSVIIQAQSLGINSFLEFYGRNLNLIICILKIDVTTLNLYNVSIPSDSSQDYSCVYSDISLNGQTVTNLELFKIQRPISQVSSQGGLNVKNSELSTCYVYYHGEFLSFNNVNISGQEQWGNSQVTIEGQQVYLESVSFSGLNFLNTQTFSIKIFTSLFGQTLTMNNVIVQDNYCFRATLLQIINYTHMIFKSIIFKNNIITLGPLFTIIQSFAEAYNYDIQIKDLMFYKNNLITSSFLEIGTESIKANSVDLHGIQFQENLVDNLLTNQNSKMGWDFYMAALYQSSDFLSDISLFKMNCLCSYNLKDTSFFNNTFGFQVSIVLFSSENSSPRINNFTLFNNNFGCLQLTIFHFVSEFGNNISDFVFQSNSREPSNIIKLSQIFLNGLKSLQNDQTITTYNQSQSLTKTMLYNQFPIIGILTSESSVLNCEAFSIQMDNSSVFQLLKSSNKNVLLQAYLSDINIFRKSFGLDIFDYGFFDIKGLLTIFQLNNVKFNGIRLGKGSLLSIQPISSQLFAPYRVIIKNFTIINAQLYILDNGMQYSLFFISNTLKQRITIDSLSIINFTLLSFPLYYESFNSYSGQNISYFSTPKNQSFSTQDQTAFINIKSVYSSVIFSNFLFQNVSTEYAKYGIYLNSQNVKIKNLNCFNSLMLMQGMNPITQYFITLYSKFILIKNVKIFNQTMTILNFYTTNISLENVVISHQKKTSLSIFANIIQIKDVSITNQVSSTKQILFLQTMGIKSYISLTNLILKAIQQGEGQDQLPVPMILIQSSTTAEQIILIQVLIMNSIQNFHDGGLLSIQQLVSSQTKIYLSHIIFKQIIVKEDSNVINIALMESCNSNLTIEQIFFFQDQAEPELFGVKQFNFINIQSVGQLTLKNIHISSPHLSKALTTHNVSYILFQCLQIFQIIPASKLIGIESFRQIIFDKIIITNLSIDNQQRGIIAFENTQSIYSQPLLRLQNILITRNNNKKCCTSFWYIQNVKTIVSNLTAFKNHNISIFDLDHSSITIDQSYFKSNKLVQNDFNQQSVNGSIIHSYQSQVLISRSLFAQINGSYLGGAIYFFVEIQNLEDPKYNLYLTQENQFSDCEAQYGGAIYHRSLNPSVNFQGVTWQRNNDYQNQFSNIASIPDSLFVTVTENNVRFDQPITHFQEQISESMHCQINNITSGSYLNLTIQIREGQSTHYDQLNVTFVGWGDQVQFQNGFYLFQTQMVKNSSLNQILSVKAINTVRHNYRLVKNLYMWFNLRFRPCLPGEIIIISYPRPESMLQDTICEGCPQNTYQSNNKCQDCPKNINCLDGTLYQIDKGYWRNNFTSDQLTECVFDACFENRANFSQCLQGYMGPLCESCDVGGITWVYNFQRSSKHTCIQCTKNQSTIQVYLLFGILIILSVQFQLQSTYVSNMSQCLVRYIRTLGILPLGSSGLFNDNVYIKTLIFHFQILSMLYGMQNQNILSQLIEKQNLLGNQSQALMFTQDCTYGLYKIPIPSLAYIDVISAILYSLLIMVIGLLMSLSNQVLKQFKPKYQQFVILYSYWTQIPQIAFYIMAAISCRQVIGNYFVKADMSQTCFGPNHIFYILTLLIPTLLLQILSGLLGLFFLSRNRNRLHLIKIQILYGMLYQEYKSKYCYFEIIKLYFKLILVLLINILGDQQVIMTSVINLLLVVYYFLLTYLQPYTYHKTQKIDQYQIIVLFFTIQLMTILQFQTQIHAQIIVMVFTVGINLALSFKIILHLLMQSLKLPLRKVYDLFAKHIPSIIRFIHKPRTNSIVILIKWKKLRAFVITSPDQKRKSSPRNEETGNFLFTDHISSEIVVLDSKLVSDQDYFY